MRMRFPYFRRILISLPGQYLHIEFFLNRVCEEILLNEKEEGEERFAFLHMDNPMGFHAMHEACKWSVNVDEEQKMKVINVLLSHNAQSDNKSNDGSTPLMGAAMAGYEDIARLLIGLGANMDLADRDGWVRVGSWSLTQLVLHNPYQCEVSPCRPQCTMQ